MSPDRRPRRWGAWSVLPALLVAIVVVGLPLTAFVELPFENRAKNFLGLEYKPAGCAPIHDRGAFGAWRDEGRLPTLLEEGRAVGVGDSAYLVGGVVTPVVDNFARSTSDFLRYDFESGSFTRLADLPRRLNHVGVAAADGAIYAVGGLGDKLEYRSEASDALWRYDIADGEWTELEPMPTARGALGAAIVDDTLYAIGGRDGRDSLATVEAYDLGSGTWSERSPLAVRRDHLGVAAAGGYVYAVGGRYEGGQELSDLQRYDPGSDRWEALARLPIGTSGVDLDRIGPELVVTGGEDSEQAYLTGRTFAFDPRAGRWRELPSSPRPKHGYASAGHGRRLYVFGGARCAGSTPTDTIESLAVG